jgi:hypothetical protein
MTVASFIVLKSTTLPVWPWRSKPSGFGKSARKRNVPVLESHSARGPMIVPAYGNFLTQQDYFL